MGIREPYRHRLERRRESPESRLSAQPGHAHPRYHPCGHRELAKRQDRSWLSVYDLMDSPATDLMNDPTLLQFGPEIPNEWKSLPGSSWGTNPTTIEFA